MSALVQISFTNTIASQGLGLGLGLGLSHNHVKCMPNSHKKKGFVHCQSYESHPSSSSSLKGMTGLNCSEPVPYGSSGASLARARKGIGIVKFLSGKVFFVTGATGFLAKVLIEKLLRTVPDVGKIYIMIKAKNRDDALKRLKHEIREAEIFKRLKEIHGKSYEGMMESKLVPIIGNIGEPYLGLDELSASMIAQDVHIIINSAASTNFHERYDVALDINTMGPSRVAAFAKKCKKLILFLQISTAYVNLHKQGIVMETPIDIREFVDSSNPISPLDVECELSLARQSSETARRTKDIGLQRAKNYGWQDPYVFTKAMGEMLLGSMIGDIPIVIIRPSIIESSYNDPFLGWIEGNRMLDPVIIQFGKGELSAFPADPNGVLDIVPVDMVANAILAAIAKHGITSNSTKEATIYQVTSSAVNLFRIRDLIDYTFKYFTRWPCLDAQGRPINIEPFRFFESMDDFLSHLWIESSNKINSSMDLSSEGKHSRKIESLCKKVVAQAKKLAFVYAPYVYQSGRFDNGNTSLLWESMSEEERKAFDKSIDWEDYICDVHIPGLRRHLMKEKSRTLA